MTARNRKALIYCTDEGGFPYAAFSAAQAARLEVDRDYDILICHTKPLTLHPELEALGIRTVTLDLADKLSAMNTGRKLLPPEVYLRLWLGDIFRDDYDRILYLDMDTEIVCDRLSDLMDIDLHGKPFGAVRDVQQWKSPYNKCHEHKVHNIRRAYLNSGVLVIDVAAWNAAKCRERAVAFSASGTKVVTHDQGLFNLALHDDWAEMHPAWNWQWGRGFSFFDKAVIPCIQHYCGKGKPWRSEYHDGRFAYRTVIEYQAFMRRYFPEFVFDVAPREDFRRPAWYMFKRLVRHLWRMPNVYRYINRFDSDLDTKI